MSEMPTITINVDARCSRCGKKGAANTGGISESGICLNCLTKQITKGGAMPKVDTSTGEVIEEEWRRCPDVEKVIDGLVAKVHRRLEGAHFIALGRPECTKKHGKQIWASVKLASPAEKILSDDEVDYIVTVGLDVWTKLPENMRLALIDHELSHAGGYDHETGKWTYVEHDIEEFSGVLQRHGAWRADLVAFLEVAQKVELPQTTFAFPGEGGAK